MRAAAEEPKFVRNLHVCVLSCREWDHAEFQGICRHNQKPIQDNAEADECPHSTGRKFESRGIGDSVAKAIQKATGKKPCGGCAKRRDLLNKALPYKRD